MSAEAWIAVAGLALEIVIGVFILHAKIVRMETMMAPLVTWFYDDGPLAWKEAHLHAVRDGVQAAVLKVVAQDRARDL